MWLHVPGVTSACSADTGGSTSPSTLQCETLAASCTSRGKLLRPASWLAAWKKGTLPRRLSGLTLPPATMASCAEEWMRSLEAGHALPCPSPESSGGRKTSAGSGARSREPYAKLEPGGSWGRTCPGCYLPGMEPPAERYSGAWPNSGSMRSGCCYQRQPWAPPSKGSDSGSWPTATAIQSRNRTSGRQPGSKHNDGVTLNDAAWMWPTPDAQTMNDGMTPEAWAEFCRRSKEKHCNGNGHGTTLAMATTLWQTPAVPSGGRMGLRTEEGREGQERHLEHQSVSVAQDLWSTPRASDGEKGGPGMTFGAGGTPLPAQPALAMWATPTTQDSENDGSSSQAARNSPPLNAQVAQEWGETPTGLWPTPNAEEATGYMSGSNRDTWRPTLSGLAEGKEPVLHQGRPSSLPAPPTGTPGVSSSPPPPGSPPPSPRKRLNPRFVEWLMGLPPGWVTGRVESINFACWATESSRRLALLLS